MRIGVISDTHGLLRPEAVAFLRGCDHILHAGDVGRAEVLAGLEALAPLTAIRGNIDTAAWAHVLPEAVTLDLAGVCIHLIHDRQQLQLAPAANGIDVVIAGHSHKPSIGRCKGVLYMNPGSAGPRRFRLPISIGELRIDVGQLHPRLVDLAAATSQ